MSLEHLIERRAKALGFLKVGIIKPQAMEGYVQRLIERMARVPDGERLHRALLEAFDVRRAYPWARSVVISYVDNTRYYLPRVAVKHYGKHFLTDNRFNVSSPAHKMILALTSFMEELGLRTSWNEHPGVTGLRWAAQEAGLGIIRRNNFFYTRQTGSYVALIGWVTDGDMSLTHQSDEEPCPPDCQLCFRACPTGSLSGPFTMNMATCVSNLNSFTDSTDIGNEAANRLTGSWLYGCDVCQDACPFNEAASLAGPDMEFPGLKSISSLMAPEVIAELGYEELNDVIRPKFFYIGGESLWRWRLNAINVLINTGSDERVRVIKKLLDDPFDIVRRRARKALDDLLA
jgi:epoxyqueuosine reductase